MNNTFFSYLSIENRKFDLLHVVRGLAAFSVLIYHSIGFHGSFPLINTPGRTSVWIFFGISGYVIGYGFIHGRYKYSWIDMKDFYINRFLRIYPMFLFLSLLGLISTIIITGKNQITLKDLPAQFLALQFEHTYVLNTIFWTLGIEIQFYLIAPILLIPSLFLKGKKKILITILIYFIVCLWLFYTIVFIGWLPDQRNLIGNLPHFLTGIIGCQIVEHFKPNTKRLSLALGTAFVLLLTTNALWHRMISIYWSPAGFFLVDLLIFSLIVAHASIKEDREDTPRIVVSLLMFMGTLSFGVFAWHGYLMQYFPFFNNNLFPLIIVSYLTAYGTYRCIETPAMRFKKEHPLVHKNTDNAFSLNKRLEGLKE